MFLTEDQIASLQERIKHTFFKRERLIHDLDSYYLNYHGEHLQPRPLKGTSKQLTVQENCDRLHEYKKKLSHQIQIALYPENNEGWRVVEKHLFFYDTLFSFLFSQGFYINHHATGDKAKAQALFIFYAVVADIVNHQPDCLSQWLWNTLGPLVDEANRIANIPEANHKLTENTTNKKEASVQTDPIASQPPPPPLIPAKTFQEIQFLRNENSQLRAELAAIRQNQANTIPLTYNSAPNSTLHSPYRSTNPTFNPVIGSKN